MGKTNFTVLPVVAIFILFVISCASPPRTTPAGFTQNITFNGYWELPDGNILLINERLYFFAIANGNLTGAIGHFSHIDNRLYFQYPSFGTIPFNYAVVDSDSIRVTDTSGQNAWAHGIWRKRTNIPGTTVNHRIIGYWEGRIGDTTRILYIAGNDIVPAQDMGWFDERHAGQLVAQDGWLFDFDRENNLVEVRNLFFRDGQFGGIFLGNPPGFDAIGRPFRFDGAELLVNFLWETNNTEIRFVRR